MRKDEAVMEDKFEDAVGYRDAIRELEHTKFTSPFTPTAGNLRPGFARVGAGNSEAAENEAPCATQIRIEHLAVEDREVQVPTTSDFLPSARE